MKKLIAAFTLMLAFSINANAQDKNNQSAYNLAKKQAAELTEYLGLDKTQNENFVGLFEQKFSVLENKDLTQERKDEFSRVVEAKIRASLDSNLMDKLEKNQELFQKLIH
jgi:peroxiredoxin